MNTNISVARLAGSLGAEVHGLSLARTNDSDVEIIEELLFEHQVLFFPEQFLDIDSHVSLGHKFGELESHPNLKNPFSQHPEIFELAASHGGLADEWHSDISFQTRPSVMSILNMLQCPSIGGDTLWTSTYAAFDALSAPLRDMCSGLTALHDATVHGTPDVAAIHPVVRVHPVTQRKALFVNEHFTQRIVELSHQESKMLLEYLFHWIALPRFTVRYRWQAGTIAMWDNRCTQHFVLSDFDEERVIQRVTIMGDTPQSTEAPRWNPFVRGENVGASSRYDVKLNNFLGRDVMALEDNKR